MCEICLSVPCNIRCPNSKYEPEPIKYCDICKGELYEGDYAYEIEDKTVCDECINNYRVEIKSEDW